VQADLPIRWTDRFNATSPGGGTTAATMVDIPFPIGTSCAATADPAIGSTCALDTSINAIVPGAVVEGKRAIWALGQIQLQDGGSDGVVSTLPNTVFAKQGIFVP